MKKPLAFTPGEPAGIGPDLAVQISQQQLAQSLVAFADPDLLQQRAQQLGLPLNIKHVQGNISFSPAPAGSLYVRPVSMATPATAGHLDQRNAPYVLETIALATKGCQDGDYAGLVTGPIHKGIINDAGTPFTGHTEYLAKLTGGYPVMMLACPGLRVALVTTHLPLKDVSAALTQKTLRKVIEILQHDLVVKFGIKQPRILVCGLNPHAGEGGHMGTEEIEIISPLLEQMRQQQHHVQLIGPLPADTLFTPRYLQKADAVLAMYHDQGLPVLKHKGFGHAVNITLGLPIVRTSVDHGTALDLAATGKAETGSLLAAIQQAGDMITSAPLSNERG